MSDPTAIILAAGRGTRMRSTLPKPLVPVAGRAIVARLIDSLEAAGVGDVVLVVGFGADQVRAALGDRVRYAVQADQQGMAHAVECAREAAGDASELLVFVGDGPLVRPQSVSRLIEVHRATGAAASFLTARFPVHLPYARVAFDATGSVSAATEARDATSEALALPHYLSSHYLFRAAALWPRLARIAPHPRTGERYLTDIVGLLIADGLRVQAVEIDDWRELVGPNTPEEVAWAEGVLAGHEPPFPASAA